jgi:hypothetical protein
MFAIRFLSALVAAATIPGLSCVLAAAEGTAGPLRTHPDNPRYFADAAGRTVWLTGSHTWANFQERGVKGQTPDFDYDAYLDFLHKRGHNFIRLWVWEHAQWMQFAEKDVPVRYEPLAYQRTGPGDALDGKPRFDLTKFNEEYFRRLRERIEKAGDRGIYVGVMLFQGFSFDKRRGKAKMGNAWRGHPFNSANNINRIDGNPSGDDTGREVHQLSVSKVTSLQEAYVRKTINTVGDLDNVLWEIGNECHAGSVAWQYHMIRFIKECESTRPKQHPVGMTGAPIGVKELMASPADWVSPPGKQWLTAPVPNDGKKIVLVDTDHCSPWNHDPDWVWKNLFQGNQFILMDGYVDYRLGSPAKPDPKWDPTRRAMGRARAFAEHIDPATLVPRPDLASTGYCLASRSDHSMQYAVYLPKGGEVTVDLGAASGTLAVEWFSTTTGQIQADTPVTGPTRRRFVAPLSGPTILRLTGNRGNVERD